MLRKTSFYVSCLFLEHMSTVKQKALQLNSDMQKINIRRAEEEKVKLFIITFNLRGKDTP